MGQFEYSVDLARVMPEDIDRVAKQYLLQKEIISMNLKPLEDKIVIKPIKEDETTTASGFILTSKSDDKPSEGIVVAVGPGITFDNGKKLVPDLNVGDRVSYSKYGGTEVGEYVILPYRDIFAVIEEA